MKMYDRVFINGKIFTSDSSMLYADTMAIKDGRIVFIGSGADRSFSGETVIDMKGKRILPGLIDSHMHPIMLAANMKEIVCLPPYINSIEELKTAIKRVRQELGPDKWILGWGYDEGKLSERRAPTRWDLDEGAADAPVCIVRSCGHSRCVNSKVLEIAGITEFTPDPPGGEIAKDSLGKPNGILRENARILLKDILPPDDPEDIAENLLHLSSHLLSQGITAISDMGNLDDTDYYNIYLRAREKGFKQRCGIFYMWDLFKDKLDAVITPQRLSRNLSIKVQGIKIISDGGISGRTAWCNRPYLGGDEIEYGISTCTEEDIMSAIDFCKKHKVQLSIHAMGQNAMDFSVDILSGEPDWLDGQMPHARIEHGSMPTPNALKKSTAADIAYVTQPVFLYAEIERYLENMGIEWLQTTFPVRDIVDSGIRLAFSTDAPATPLADASNPFICLKAAVTRRASDGTDCGQYHAVDIETAIRFYTAEGAYVMGFADAGILKIGNLADFIVLDRDILSIPPDEIDKVKVLETYIEGASVYKA